MENERDGSTACFEFGFKPQGQCKEAAKRQSLRCCNLDLVLNKFKMYVGEWVPYCSWLRRWARTAWAVVVLIHMLLLQLWPGA